MGPHPARGASRASSRVLPHPSMWAASRQSRAGGYLAWIDAHDGGCSLGGHRRGNRAMYGTEQVPSQPVRLNMTSKEACAKDEDSCGGSRGCAGHGARDDGRLISVGTSRSDARRGVAAARGRMDARAALHHRRHRPGQALHGQRRNRPGGLDGWGSLERPWTSRTTPMTRRAVAAGSRSKVEAGSSDGARRFVIDLGRANSRSPSSPWMRPNPESPTPPNGSARHAGEREHRVDRGHAGAHAPGQLQPAALGEDRRRPARTAAVGQRDRPRRRRGPG